MIPEMKTEGALICPRSKAVDCQYGADSKLFA